MSIFCRVACASLLRAETFLGSLVLATGWGATAQAQAGANAITDASDAFGYKIGNESVGIYDERRVRGFNLEAAGNYRIDGYYFVRSSGTSSPLVENVTVGVGRNTFATDLPGPSGVVHYRMKTPTPKRPSQASFHLNTYQRPQFELLQNVASADGQSGLIGALLVTPDENDFQGGDGSALLLGAAAGFRLGEARVRLFGIEYRYERDAQHRITTSGPVLPPEIERRRFLGQEWAREQGQSRLAGAIVERPLGGEWQLGAAGFFSQNHPEKAFLQLFSQASGAGAARSMVIASPEQRFTAWSGEARVGWHRQTGDFDHRLSVNVRGRRSRARFGGDAVLDLGTTNLFGEQTQAARFSPAGRAADIDAVDQFGAGLTYRFVWRNRLMTSAALFKTHYEKVFTRAGLLPQQMTASPWLYNGIAIVQLTSDLSAYGSYTRGLEEAGVAPLSAVNRNAVLPPILVTQKEAGLRYALSPHVSLVLAAFDIHKPYAGLRRDTNVYDLIGNVRHKGVEASLTGEIAQGLTAVIGGYLMKPELRGIEVESGRIGPRPVSVPGTRLTFNLNYRLPVADDIAIDGRLEYAGRQAAHSAADQAGENELFLPAATVMDLGARYRFKAGRFPVALRAQIQNVLNEYSWQVTSAEAFSYSEPRRFRLSLTMDY